jgi:predicted XRE-type DNA-binding protein
MRHRRVLMDLVHEIVRRDGLRDYDIARMCRTSRTRASTLIHNHIRFHNSESIIDILARLGVTIEINVVKRQRYLRWEIRNGNPHWRLPPDFRREPPSLTAERSPLAGEPPRPGYRRAATGRAPPRAPGSRARGS